MKINYCAFLTLLFCLLTIVSEGQDEGTTTEKEIAYTQTITKRADKIVQTLGTADSIRVREVIVARYRQINDIHNQYNNQKKQFKEKSFDTKEKQEKALQKNEEERLSKLNKGHKKYIAKLEKYLSDTQVEQVKDGMTYGVVPITYKGYQEMLPNLTADQKKQILSWLHEARDYAMDAESSEKKHAWFGKYKGRINNYLSASGIDMKKASKEWEERIAREKKH